MTQLDQQGQSKANERKDIKKEWNWAAFSIPVIWGLFNGVYLPIGAGIAIVIISNAFGAGEAEETTYLICSVLTLCLRIGLGIFGNYLSYYETKDEYTGSFEARQRKWSRAGFIIFWIILVIYAIGGYLSI